MGSPLWCAGFCRWPPSWPETPGTRVTCRARWYDGSHCRGHFWPPTGYSKTFLTVLAEFGAYPAVIARELDRYLPFLGSTKVLMAAVKGGSGREQAHAAIKQHAVAVALAMREQGEISNDLLPRLAGDPRLGLRLEQLQQLLADPVEFVGAAEQQIAAVVSRVAEVAALHPGAVRYLAEPIL